MSTRLRLLGALLLAALWFAPTASAQRYPAAFVGQCCSMTLESGEVAGGQYFEFRNTGAETWIGDFVLGTSSPRNRPSDFWNPATWRESIRPAALNVQAVAPGQIGRFNFTVRAPSVAATRTYREVFEPVRENVEWSGSIVWLDYTVLPSVPPTVGFTSVPAQVARGEAIGVAVEATDNRAVDHVDFTVGGKTVSVGTPDGRIYRAQLPTDALESGPQTVIAKAVDRVGNFATATAGFSIAAPPGSVPLDRDGDGSLDTADCNDTNSSIHPGAPELPGNGVDDDCAGGDAPGTVAATVLNSWTAGKKSSRVMTLKARNVPAGATIETRCSGKGCPFKLKRRAVPKAGDVDLRKLYFKRASLRVGAVLEIRILAPGSIAKVARFTVRSHKAPLSRYLCLPPGAKKAGACS